MRDRTGKRVGRIGLFDLAGWQQAANHGLYLFLLCMADADDALLDVVGRVFGDLETGLCAGEQRNSTGMADLQRGRRILGDEGQFDGDG